jgi:WD40 repeat protein
VFAPDGATFVVAHEDGALRVWDPDTGRAAGTLATSGPEVTALAFRNSDSLLVAIRLDGTVSAWSGARADTPAWTAPPLGPTPEDDSSWKMTPRRGCLLRITDDGEGVLVVRQNHLQRLDPIDGDVLASWGCGPEKELVTMSFRGGSSRVAISLRPLGHWTGQALLLDERTLEPVPDLRTKKPSEGDTLPAPLQSLDLAPDGRSLAATSQGQWAAYAWRYGQPESLARLRGHTYGVMEGRFSPDGRRYATASNDSTVRLWETERDEDRTAIAGLDRRFLHISTDGRVAVTTNSPPSGAKEMDVAVQNVSTGETLLGPWTLPYPVYALFDNDGTSVWIGSNAGLSRLALTDGEVLESWSSENIPSLAGAVGLEPSRDGRTLLVFREGHGFFILDRQLSTVRVLPWVPRSNVRLSPEGKRLLVNGGALATVSVWDFATGREQVRLRGHTGHITGFIWSPDGTRIATGAVDSSARLWDAATGRELFRLGGLQMHGHEVQFSPDGSILVVHGSSILHLFRSSDGVRTATMEFPARVSGVRFHGNDRFTVVTDAATVHVRPVDPMPDARRRLSRSLTFAELSTHAIGTKELREETERETIRASLKTIELSRGAMVALSRGDLQEGRFLVDRALALRPRFEEVLRVDACALALESTTESPDSPRRRALIDRALDRLEDALRRGRSVTSFLIGEPLLEPLRREAKFAAIMEMTVDRLVRESPMGALDREQALDLGEALLRLFPDRPEARFAAARARAWRADLHEVTDPARAHLRGGAMELLLGLPKEVFPPGDAMRNDPAFLTLRDEPGFPVTPR